MTSNGDLNYSLLVSLLRPEPLLSNARDPVTFLRLEYNGQGEDFVRNFQMNIDRGQFDRKTCSRGVFRNSNYIHTWKVPVVVDFLWSEAS